MMVLRSINPVRWAVALAVVALGIGFVSVADAQTTPLCPPSIAPVKGGLGDATSLGLDDGARGAAAKFEPGELIVVLRPGRTAKDLRCVASELRAVVVEGGAGKRGLGGIPNAVVLQLPAGVSVERTAQQLLQPRYRGLILTAQPNRIGSVERNDNASDPTVKDPLFPLQWGLSLARDGLVPKTNVDPFPYPWAAGDLEANPFASAKESRRYSMRVRQAWKLLSRQPLGVMLRASRVRVAIVDDSLAYHPDLDRNVAADGNARTVEGLSAPRIELLKRAGTSKPLIVRDEWDVKRTLCPLTWNLDKAASRPDPDWVAQMVASQTDRICNKALTPTTWRVVLDGAYRGSVAFTYDNQVSPPIDVSPLWNKDGDHQAVLRQIEQTLGLLLAKNRAPAGVVAVFRTPQTWDLGESRKRELRIVLYDRPGQLDVDAAGLTSAWFPTSVIASNSQGNEIKDAQKTTFEVGVIFGSGGTFRVRYELTIRNPIGMDPPVTYAIETSDLSVNANATEVATRLNNAVQGAGIDPADLRFEADPAEPNVPGLPRVFEVTAIRPVQDLSWLDAESMRVTAAAGIASDPVQATATRIAARGTLQENADGTTATIDLNVPAIKSIATQANETDLKVGMRASADVVDQIDPATKWPGQAKPGADHGQFIAGIIGAQANDQGMVGVIGDQDVTRTKILMNGLVTDLSTTSVLSMFEYAIDKLNAPVVNFSAGSLVSTTSVPGLYDDSVSSSRRNDILRREDPLPPDIKQMIIGNAADANRTLFVVAAGNEGGDVRRPAQSLRVLRQRNADDAEKYLKAKRPGASAAEIKKVRDRAIAETALGQFPCRPKGMGVTERPVGNSPKQQTKGGTLSMLRMPDGTFDRGNILCVAASDWNGHLTEFSNWGPGIVDVAAPGANIVGTRIGNGYSTGNGTSFSAPMVAAVAAMIYNVIPNAQPWLVKCAILSSATSKPLRVDPTRLPYRDLTVDEVVYGATMPAIPYPDGGPLTVSGVVQAPEAISAALHLDARVKRKLRGGIGSGSWPTCVQKRGFFGGWKNTPVLGN